MIGRGWKLRTQIGLLVGAVLIVSQLLSLWLFVDERSLAIRAAIGAEAAGRAANVAKLIEVAPVSLHPQIIAAANSPLIRFDLAQVPSVTHENHAAKGTVAARIRSLMGDSFSRAIRVEVHEARRRVMPLPNLSPRMAEMHARMMGGRLSAIEMEISIALSGGSWLNVGTRFERPPIQWSRAALLRFGLTAGLLLLAVFWFVLTRLTRPLGALAVAAERFGRGEATGPLAPVGPREVRDLTAAFNTMQDRITRFVADRTQMLAALAHDLRSPLTALRVQTELVSDTETRKALTQSLDEMTAMTEATLAFAKGVGRNEKVVSVAIGDIVEAAATDARVSVTGGAPVTLRLRRQAVTRALRNLIENALRYGAAARVGWQVADGHLEIRVDDDGPGIPEAEIDKVVTPYYRLEASRSRQTGGHGLGLAIARGVALSHGGELILENRAGGGLRAMLRLPIIRDEAQDSPDAEDATKDA